MNVRRFQWIVTQTLLVPVLLPLGVAAVLTWQIHVLVTAEYWFDHSDQVNARLRELDSAPDRANVRTPAADWDLDLLERKSPMSIGA
jgi:hypothetical protein